jgi:LuxR family maltose regulon positive regulatory protein
MLKFTIARVTWNAQDASYQVQEGASLALTDFESQEWLSWLEQRSSFAFSSRDRHRFTARKEARARGSIYWIAYRKMGGKLTHTYLGRPEDVTQARLEQVARFLAGQDSPDANSLLAREQQFRQEPSNQMRWKDQYLATKFFVPGAPHALVARPRLFSLLEEGRLRPLTLVSAPAGFGKTTLLSAWVQAQPPGNPLVAWVSLDEEDNDPVRFWSYVLTALDRLWPGMCREFVAYLQAEAHSPLNYVLTACLNRLSTHPEPVLLVLDDYHLMTEEAIHTTLTSFIMSAREDPLPFREGDESAAPFHFFTVV